MKITRAKLRQIIREQITTTSSPGVEPVDKKAAAQRKASFDKAVAFGNWLVSNVKDEGEKKVIMNIVLAAHSISIMAAAEGVDDRIAEEWHQGIKRELDAGLELAGELKAKKAPPTDNA